MLPFNRCDIPLPFPDPEAGDLAGFVGVPFVGVPAFTQATPDGPTAVSHFTSTTALRKQASATARLAIVFWQAGEGRKLE